ncbi:MAG: VanZ family protein, partial [Calditrichae bacterium]|nr:VanZ family protein [Calditrichia bacterium]
YILIAIIIGIVYGISDEYHQSFVPGRFADVVDALADTLGIIIGVLLFRFVPFFYRN